MIRKSFTCLFILILCISFSAHAKIWRINNNPGVVADFTAFNTAATSGTVSAGDTIYLEASATNYGTASFSLNKRLVVIGTGYFLDPANTGTPANTGLQAATQGSKLDFFRIADGANGSKFIGVHFTSGPYLGTSANPWNLLFEKCLAVSFFTYLENAVAYNTITIRKCFIQSAGLQGNASATLSNFTCENNIFYGSYIILPQLTGTGNIIRNNSFFQSSPSTISNAYVANNIFATGSDCTFTNCTIKNNLFQSNQILPPTATGNLVSVNITNVYVGGSTGSLDSRMALRPGSPAIGAGLTVGTVTSPDCGAFGATDPYKLSGIPNIPSIYALTVPVSIPAGTNTMNITFSTRNNN